jgi:hypothetical protein
MNCGKILVWRFGIASTALLAAIAVYCLARLYPPELLVPFHTTQFIFADQTGLFGSAPSFLYTLAIGLLVGSCTSAQADSRMHCLIWIGLALLLEVTQHSVIAESITSWLADMLDVSTWELVGPYWTHGAFDPLDIIATVAGGIIALVILNHSPMEIKSACG